MTEYRYSRKPRFKMERLIRLREEKGILPSPLSKELGLDVSYITKIEAGKSRQPSGSVVFLLARYFNVQMEYFYSEDDLE